MRKFSEEILKSAEEASFSLYDEYAQADADFKSIFDSWKNFRNDIQQWHSFNETDYNVYIASQINQ